MKTTRRLSIWLLIVTLGLLLQGLERAFAWVPANQRFAAGVGALYLISLGLFAGHAALAFRAATRTSDEEAQVGHRAEAYVRVARLLIGFAVAPIVALIAGLLA